MAAGTSFDHFFYYGLRPRLDEAIDDLTDIILQPKRSMFYNRSFGTELSGNRNMPKGGFFDALIRYDIANAVARNNSEISDGTNNSTDRRIAVSQQSIQIIKSSKGLDLSVDFIFFDGYNQINNFNIPLPLNGA